MLATTIFGLQLVDILAIVLYFGITILIGFRAMKHVKTQEDYFLGGRQFGKLIQTFAAFGQGTSADNAVSTTSMASKNGVSGVWATLAGHLANLPLLWMVSLWYCRMRLLTLADFFQERYDSKVMAGFDSLSQVALFMVVVNI